MVRLNTDAQHRRFRAQFVRRAIETQADLLAIRLHRYAVAGNQTWEELALSLGIEVDALNQIALCPPPRSDHFVVDTEEIAAAYVDADRLLALLRHIQIQEAWEQQDQLATGASTAQAPSHVLLAARDREADDPDTEPPIGEDDRV